ncbi:MAG TPA: SDR family NAD(P)-dependent oxidoreductase [Roseococcus sp.]|jgi:acyl transferase domain-containing protein/NAD(P)-dependent dehydrogenase (short-subunit alcohol dehydrogenase family)/acyl carrier protein|nr:SDR family NAD(P)-dependent oxidoreductase [Roseococcus sp.]
MAEPNATPLQRAMLAIERLQRRAEAAEAQLAASRAPLPILGLACRLPGGANDPEACWQVLRAGLPADVEVPPERWDAAALHDPDPAAEGKMITRRAGFLRGWDPAGFDAAFWGIAPTEAEAMDPQARLLLELAWEALEDAGLPAPALRGRRIGTFIGAMHADYAALPEARPEHPHAGPGNDASFLAGRIAHLLGLRGPAVTVATACSASLVALHQAAAAIRAGEIEAAIVGGVSLMLSPGVFIGSSRLGAISADGRCKPFLEGADGYGRGEGGVVLVLGGPAPEAGLRPRALLRGSAVNHNGGAGAATIPSGPAQAALLRAALAASGLTPAELDAVEAHGTGTRLGDPIELRALAEVFAGRPVPLRLGAAKAVFGHTEPASGLAGVAKMVLALEAGEFAPQPEGGTPTPLVDWPRLPMRLVTRPEPWPREAGRVRRAGVSSFGLSGTNAHVVLEEAPEPAPPAPAPEGAAPLLLVSAAEPAALRDLAGAWAARLAQPSPPLPALLASAARHRAALPERLAVTGPDAAALRAGLLAFQEGRAAEGVTAARAEAPPRLVFLFGGQGGQWAAMGQALLRAEPAFAAAVEEVAAALDPLTGWRLREVLEQGIPPDRLAAVDLAQPLVFAMQVALARLWRGWGVVPDLVLGQSLGEVAAAVVAGALTLEDGARLAVARSGLLARVAGAGAMAVAELDAAAAAAELAQDPRLSLAVEAGPASCVLAGPVAAVEALLARLAAANRFGRRIAVDVASHTPAVEPLLAPLRAALAGITPRRAAIPFLSTVTGEVVAGEALDAGYWAANLRQPVRLWPALRHALSGLGAELALEVGPHPVVAANAEAAAAALGHAGFRVLPSLRRDQPGALRASLGALWTRGLGQPEHAFPVVPPAPGLPRYPWQRRRFWWGGRPPEAQASLPADALFRLGWEAPPPLPQSPPARWTILAAPDDPRAAALAALLPGEIITECPARPETPVLVLAAELDPRRLAALGQAPRLVLVTPELATSPRAAALWGLGQALALERPGCAVRLVEVLPGATDAGLATAIRADGAEDRMRVGPGGIEVARLLPATSPPPAPLPAAALAGPVLVTGGLGRLGLALARHLVARGARHLVLGARGPAHGARAEAVAALRASGARVEVVAADLGAPGGVAALLAACGGAPSAVFHLAGASTLARLEATDEAAWRAVFAAKAEAALELDALTRAAPPAAFVLFGSAAGVWGAPGQGAYAAANAVLSALAAQRRAAGLPALAVSWGRWADSGQGSAETEAFLDAIGLLPMPQEAGFAALEALLAGPDPAPVVAPLARGRFLAMQSARPLFAALAVPGSAPGGEGAARLRALPAAERLPALTLEVARLAGQVMGYPPEAPPAPEDGFFRLGMDSVMAVRLRAEIERDLGLALEAATVFAHPSAAALARHLLGLLAPPGQDAAPEDTLDEAEAEAQLLAELAELRAEGR